MVKIRLTFPNKHGDIIKAIDKAITADDSEENVYVCDGCKEEIK